MTFTPTPCLSVRHQLQNLVEYLFFVHDNTDETWWRGVCGTRKTLKKNAIQNLLWCLVLKLSTSQI